MSTVELRRAEADDAAFIAEMVAEAVSWDRRPGEMPPAVADLAEYPRVADYFSDWPRPGDDGFIAEAEGVPIGACWIRRFTAMRPGHGFLGEDVPGLGLALRQTYRGRGLGTRLLAATLALARESGVRQVGLSVADGNAAAKRLYERAGFEPVGLDEEGSWTMRLTLSATAATRPGLLIRAAQDDDATAIVSLMREMDDFFEAQATATPESVRAMLGDEDCEALVAELDGEVVGVVAWYFYRSLANTRRSAVIEDFSVTAAHRDQGIGRALLREAIDRIRPEYVAFTFIAAAPHNERAKHLYRSLGFIDDDMLMILGADGP